MNKILTLVCFIAFSLDSNKLLAQRTSSLYMLIADPYAETIITYDCNTFVERRSAKDLIILQEKDAELVLNILGEICKCDIQNNFTYPLVTREVNLNVRGVLYLNGIHVCIDESAFSINGKYYFNEQVNLGPLKLWNNNRLLNMLWYIHRKYSKN